MKTTRFAVLLVSLIAVQASLMARATEMAGPVQPNEIKWSPVPSVLPAGGQMAVLSGDPAGTGLVTLRLKMPPGYQIPPHWHPTDEHVTVISGTLALGMGDTLDREHSKILRAGGYAVAPASMHHFAWTKTGGIVEINLIGPFAITYVNTGDDPTHKK
jgi:quercetin dioxygenase-like cupin family protein